MDGENTNQGTNPSFIPENTKVNSPYHQEIRSSSGNHRKRNLLLLFVFLSLIIFGSIIIFATRLILEPGNNPSNTPAIPGANILLVLKDNSGNLIKKAQMRVDVLYENPYFNYGADFEIEENPFLLYLEPIPERENAQFKITAKTSEYQSQPLFIKSREYADRLSWSPSGQFNKTKEAIIALISEPAALKTIIHDLPNVAYIKTIVLDKKQPDNGNIVAADPFENMVSVGKTFILLYRVKSDEEDPFVVSKFEEFKSLFPQLQSTEITKEQKCKIEGYYCNDYPDESTIDIYNSNFQDYKYFSYLGNITDKDKGLKAANYYGDEGFNKLIAEIKERELPFRKLDKISLLLYLNPEDDENDKFRTQWKELKQEFPNLPAVEIDSEGDKFFAKATTISTESAIIAYDPREFETSGHGILMYFGTSSIYNTTNMSWYAFQGEGKFEEFKTALDKYLKKQ